MTDFLVSLIPGITTVIGVVIGMFLYGQYVRPFFKWIRRTAQVGFGFVDMDRLYRLYDRTEKADLSGYFLAIGPFGIAFLRTRKKES